MDWRLMTRKEIAAIVLLLGGIAVALIVFTEFPGTLWRNYAGSRPGWDCTNVGGGEPVCFKHDPSKTQSVN
jgi:hypothetical protein